MPFPGRENKYRAFCNASDKAVVVGVFKAVLESVVIYISYAFSVLTLGTPIASNSR